MALNALTLAITQGVVGRPFFSAVNGITYRDRVQVLVDGSPGGSYVNGVVSFSSLPYPTSTIVLREYEPGVGSGFRDSRIDITGATNDALRTQALASLSNGRTLRNWRVGAVRQADGSFVYSLFVEDDLGATAGLAIGGTPSPTPALGTPVLSGTLTQGTAASGVNLLGLTDGSTVTFNIAGLSIGTSGTTRAITGTPATSGSLIVTETLAGASGSPKDTTVGSVAASGATRSGTSSSIYSFVGTGLRTPTLVNTTGSDKYLGQDYTIGMPDWQVDEFYLFFPLFYCESSTNTGEISTTSVITLEGAAVWNNAGTTRVRAQIDGGLTPVVIDPNNPDTQYGKWVKITPATPIPAGATARLAFAFLISAGTFPRSPRPTVAPFENPQNSATSMVSSLSTGVNYNNTGPGYIPSMMIAKGGDGRPCIFAVGDSVGVGQDQNVGASVLQARRGYGYIDSGLDDNTTAKRLPFFNNCIVGWGVSLPTASGGVKLSHAIADSSKRQLWAIQKARDINGGVALADIVFQQHGSNTVSATTADLLTGYRNSCALWRGAVGDANTPIVGLELIQYAGTTDAFQTVAGQTLLPANAYPAGNRWLLNNAIGGANGLGDPSATLRADGTIQDSVAPWRVSAADLTSNRDRFSVRPFNTTLAAAWASGSTVQTVDSPPVGAYLNLYDSGTNTYRTGIVTGVSGTGPYTVTMAVSGTQGGLPSGAVVRDSWAGGGIHPGPNAHTLLGKSLIDWKVSKGYV